MDGKELIVYHKDSEISAFMDAVGKSEVYFNSDQGRGMWIPIDRIRYFQVQKEEDDERGAKPLPTRNAKACIEEKSDRAGGGEGVDEALQSPRPPGEPTGEEQ